MVSPCLSTRQQALKMGYFYWLLVKNSNYRHAVFSLGYLRNAKLYLKSKALFIDISIIASFKLFSIAWLREYCTFLDSSVVCLKSSPWPKYTQLGTIFQKKLVFHYQTFFFFKYVLYETVFSKYLKTIWGSPCSFKRKGEFISLSSLL